MFAGCVSMGVLLLLLLLPMQLGKEVRETTPVQRNNNPRWSKGNKFTFYDVDISKTSTIEIEVNAVPEGLAAIALKESLGEASVYMADIVDSRQVRMKLLGSTHVWFGCSWH